MKFCSSRLQSASARFRFLAACLRIRPAKRAAHPLLFARLSVRPSFIPRSLVTICLLCVSAFAAGVIQNDVFWKDASGNPIYSQGGGVLKVGSTYYWYGAKYKEAESYYKTTQRSSSTTFSSVTCYSSEDLVKWKFEGDVFTGQSGWVGRMGVAYHAGTKKYVLVSQGGGGILFATSSTPNGKFALDNIQKTPPGVANGMTGDQTVFNDDDGKAYLICSCQSGRGILYVAPLRASDYLQVEEATRIFGGAGREGNCMFKYRGRYYFCSSDLHGWNASHCYYVSATNIMGPYSTEKIMASTDLDFCHVTQTGFFITVNGTTDTTVLFCGDRWSDFAGNGLGFNQWCPLSFNGVEPVFESMSRYNFDGVVGTWSVASGNNFILNPGFEADRVSQTTLAGWTNSAGSEANGNASGAHSGNFCVQQTSTSAYTATIFQDIKTLPNGAYTLTAWVKSSGGQTSCKVFASDFGGTEMAADAGKAMSAWTQVTISGIKVTNGKCRVGVASEAKAGNWVKVDDFSLVSSTTDGVVQKAPAALAVPSPGTGCMKVVSGGPFRLHGASDNSPVRFVIYDCTGRRICNVTAQRRMADLERDFGVAPGVYGVRTVK
jgi:hypothetical protein